jgi:hypothetical protein
MAVGESPARLLDHLIGIHVRPGSNALQSIRGVLSACPLRPESGQIADRLGMSALCQKRTNASQQKNLRYSITSSAQANSAGDPAV